MTTPARKQMIEWLQEVDIIPLGTSGRRMLKAIIEVLMSNPPTTELSDKEKAIYLLDHGWEFVEPRNQEENRGPHRYTKRNAHGMSSMLLDDAYRLEKGRDSGWFDG